MRKIRCASDLTGFCYRAAICATYTIVLRDVYTEHLALTPCRKSKEPMSPVQVHGTQCVCLISLKHLTGPHQGQPNEALKWHGMPRTLTCNAFLPLFPRTQTTPHRALALVGEVNPT